MDKLIELLNEYRPNSWMEYMWWIAYIWADQYSYPVDCEVLTIISKEYGFIKRLVENDKIELHELSKKELATWWSLENNILDEENTKENWIKFWTENLLMLLAIQDEPIEFLISILK